MNRINSKRGKKTIEGHTCWYSLIIIFKSSHVLAKPPLKRSIQDNISQCDNDKTNIEMLFQNLPTALNWQLKYARKSLQIKVTHNSLPIKCVAAFSWAISCNNHNLMWSREQIIRTNVNKIPEYCTATRNAEQAHTHSRYAKKTATLETERERQRWKSTRWFECLFYFCCRHGEYDKKKRHINNLY